MKRLSLVLLMFATLTPGVATAAPYDAGHVIISARDRWGGPGFEEVDLSGVLVEDGIHLGPLHAVWTDDICAPPCEGLFADGPFWDIHVQTKQGLFLRFVSITASVVGGAVLYIDSPSIGTLDPPFEFALFAPGITEHTLSLTGGFFIGLEEPVAGYDVIVHFDTISAVPESGTAAPRGGRGRHDDGDPDAPGVSEDSAKLRRLRN
jgi:hypothetical protein